MKKFEICITAPSMRTIPVEAEDFFDVGVKINEMLKTGELVLTQEERLCMVVRSVKETE